MRHNHIGMRMNTIGLYVVLLVITAFSCEDNLQEPVQVEFEFRLLNEQGQPSTTFKEGENFVFSFLIINKSSERMFLDQRSLLTREFLRVYKINNSEGVKLIDLGTPYRDKCTMQAGFLIESNDTLKFEIPWIPDFDHYFICELNTDNTPLSKGRYKTGFTSIFDFSFDSQSLQSEQSFNINFQIQ